MRKKTKKWYRVLSLCMMFMIALTTAGCTSTGTQSEPEQEAEIVSENSGGNLGEYAVEIGDYVLAKTYEGKDAIIITMKYTNNSDEAMSYMSSLISTAYQDGVELSSAIIIDGSLYDAEAQMKELKKGASIDVQVAYELSNTTSDVEFEVEEFLSFNNETLEKTFVIAE